MEWISVKERVPPLDEPFLGYDPKKEKMERIYVLIYKPKVEYIGEFKYLSRDECYLEASGEGYFNWEPTHWMPLPLFPKDNNEQ
jgi:hypothetical protein